MVISLNLQRVLMRKSFFPVSFLGVIAVCIALAACGGNGRSPTPSPTGVSLSPIPSAQPADLALAARLYSEGAIEEATALYSRAIQGDDDGQRQRALWALARLQYQQGDNSGAEDTVETYLGEEIASDAERLALLLKGTLAFAQGDNDQAAEALTAYVTAGGPAAAYARLRLADLAGRRGDVAEAVAGTNEALLEALPAAVTTDARFALARYYEDSGDTGAALGTYELLGIEAETRAGRGEALWQAASLAHEIGDASRAAGSLRTLMAAYPSHERSLEALDDTRFAPDIPHAGRALVLFTQRANAEAQTAYQGIVEAGDATLAADAHYHLGILAERASNYEEALAQYDVAISTAAANQQTDLLGQSLWDKSTVLELLGHVEDAIQTYSSIADVAPSSEHTAEALFRAGILRFKQGLPVDAAAIWIRQRGLASDGESQARAYFWSASAARAAGDESAAQRDLGLAAAVPGADYYTLRARAELAPEDAFPPPGDLPSEDPDWSRVELWLNTQYGAEDAATRTSFFTTAAYNRMIELLRAGLQAEAEVEFEQLIDDAAGNAWLLYRLARAASDEGLHSLAARAAGAFGGAASGAPPEALALAYPLVYPQIVSEQASRNSISPFLLLGLVRQESFYDPRAVSPADATGLTQVIPTTAAGIAEDLGEDDFRNSDLFRPNVSLRFGAHYLGAQIELLEGDIPAALAAYNGGPGNAFRWQEATAVSDPDLFLETIDFSETRAYVELVLENYAIYLYAYGLTDEPSLPLE